VQLPDSQVHDRTENSQVAQLFLKKKIVTVGSSGELLDFLPTGEYTKFYPLL
jgi:hypothetical protein